MKNIFSPVPLFSNRNVWVQSFKVRKCEPLSSSTFRIPWLPIYFHKNNQRPPLGLVWTTPSILQHLNQTTKTNQWILQFKCSYRNWEACCLPQHLLLHEEKKHKGLLSSCIHYCKLKDKGGTLQRRLLQDNNNERDCVLLSPKYWLVLYPQEKEEEGGCDAPPFDFLWSKRQHGGHDVLSTFLGTWKNKTHKDLFPPPTSTIARWRQIINSMKFFVKKQRKEKKLTSLKWLWRVARNKKQGS